MMLPNSPFHCSMLDGRAGFLGLAEQLAGKVLGMSIGIDRHIRNTFWHYDNTSYDLSSVQFVNYLEPVRAETGTLRVIPESRRQPFHDEVGSIKACNYAWIRQDNQNEACAMMDEIPAFVCETNPRDMVVFDHRIYHATFGGSWRRVQIG